MHNNEWGTVCKENFDDIDARVACRQLGFRNGNVLENTKTGGNLKVWLSNVRCYGGENKLTDCSHSDWGSHHCSHDKVVGIRCGEGQGDVRINSGRLEIYYNGTWGTVCNASIGDEEATVACRQLGYNSGKSLGIGVDDGTGTIWVHTVYCNGNERRLVDCRINFNKFDGEITFYKFDGSRSYCRHNRDVGIECFSAYEGHVRIKSNGGLEIFHDNEWGAVCKEDFDDTDASVACRQLGYSFGNVDKKSTGRGIGKSWLSKVDCNGDETNLASCTHAGWGEHDCSYDVYMTCDEIPLSTRMGIGLGTFFCLLLIIGALAVWSETYKCKCEKRPPKEDEPNETSQNAERCQETSPEETDRVFVYKETSI